MFEERIDQILYPELNNIGAVSAFGKLQSKRLKIRNSLAMLPKNWLVIKRKGFKRSHKNLISKIFKFKRYKNSFDLRTIYLNQL